MSAQVEGWDDVPHASELFGGDFFGDELMEMYTADAGLNLGDAAPVAVVHSSSTTEGEAKGEGEEEAHPGVLVAMHAAAMDGGLSPMGVAAEFVPLAAGSGGELPPYPTLAPPAPAAAAAVEPASSAPAARTTRAKAAAAVAPKRPLAAPAAKAPAKKPRNTRSVRAAARAPAPVAAAAKAQVPKTAAVPARLAPAGGIKVPAVVPKASAPATRATVGRVASSSSASVAKAPAPAAVAALAARPAPLKKAPAPLAAAKASVPPKATAPAGGGIAPRAAPAPRPAPVPSAPQPPTAPRRLPPAPPPARPAAKPKGIGPQGSVCASTGVIRAKSEADFKDVASAAVASLVQNASAHGIKTTKPAVKPGETPVDVSTAHVHALTSQNWVTACAPVPPPAPDSSSACDKAARNARRAALTQEERAKQNRDRNREHARNTRLRKKAYVEELKRTLAELVARRDAREAERRRDAQREREQREVRFRVVEEFLKLRGRNEADAARWVAILEEGFALTLPATGFRQTVAGAKASALEQTLRGAAAVMEDAGHLAAYLQTIGPADSTSGAARVQVVYRCDRQKFFMDGNVAFLDFAAATHGAVAKGAATEAAFRGTVRASFSPASNKLTSVDCTFDTGAFLAQVAAIANGAAEAPAAAEARAADALLDSLRVPSIPAAAEAAAVSSDDGERSTDSGAPQS
ncbi:hypothetical protein ACHAXT_010271 [Thalassiosira profunda]